MKRGRLSKEDTNFLIDNKDKMTVEELAEKLDRTVKLINSLVKDEDKEEVEVEADKKHSEIYTAAKAGKLMARQKDKITGKVMATVMTEAASAASDDFGKDLRANQIPDRHKNAIHTINPYESLKE